MTRREMFAVSAAFAAGVEAAAAEGADAGFKLGICSYTFREFQRKMAIGMMKQLSVGFVSVKDVHLPYSLAPEELAKAAGEFKKAGLTPVSAGNTDLRSKDPAVLRTYFQYARNSGIPMLVAAPTHESLPVVEKLAKEFDIRVAIHPHGPEDQHFPSPKDVLSAVKGMDSRMGLCLDVGEGVIPTVAIFRQLKKVGYRGCVNLEYEINSENPLPGAQHSIGYMKGVVAGLG